MCEALEPRRLLADIEALAGGFAATVNFQPADVGPVEFTRADFGRPFAERGNGLNYGWNRDLESAGDVVERDSARDVAGLSTGNLGNSDDPADAGIDKRYDTFAAAEPGDSWSIEVPDGDYAVLIVAGDPDNPGDDAPFEGLDPDDPFGGTRYEWLVNGEFALLAFPLREHPYGEGIIYTRPENGRITIAASEASFENALAFVRVVQLESLPDYATSEALDWQADPLSLPAGRIEAGTFTTGDRLFIIGGYEGGYDAVTRRVDVLDLETLEFTRAADLPVGAAETHTGTAYDAARGQFYWVSGQQGTDEIGQGFDTSRDIYRYDVAGDFWTLLPVQLPGPRFAPGAAVVGDTLHVFGGTDESRVSATADHFTLDLAALEAGEEPDWQEAAPLPRRSEHFAVEVVGDQIYVVGGEHDHSVGYVPHRDLFVYDAGEDEWTLGQPVPAQVSHVEASTFVSNGTLWLFGGQVEARRLGNGVFGLDLNSGEWTVYDPLPQERRAGIAFVDAAGRAHSLGGNNYDQDEPAPAGGFVAELPA